MKKSFFILSSFLGLAMHSMAQTADDAFKEPLKVVLQEIESRYGVKLNFSDNMVKDRYVTYAEWRFRPDVEKTLDNILSTQDMVFTKTADKNYKLAAYAYHLKTPQEGKEQLEYLSTLYHDKASWEKRKAELKECMLSRLQLSPMPARPASKPIVTPVRKMDGYTVQNVAIETLPGLYVCGSLYQPLKPKGKMPIVLNPDGHFANGRYRADCQYRCATLARMGAVAFSYDLFAWGESGLQFKAEDHRRSLAETIQILNGMRILDYLTGLKGVDTTRIAMTGGSGGGSQTMLLTALDNRIKVSVPVVMVSAWHSGGCPCESGMGTHLCAGGTNNVEVAAMAAPRPMLVVSDGKDMTQTVPYVEYPYLQKMYAYYGKENEVKNVHLLNEGHDYGLSKRLAMYDFLAEHLGLHINAVKDASGKVDESKVTIEKEPAMYVFGDKGERLPANAIKSFDVLEKMFEAKK